MDAILFIMVIIISASVAIVIFKAYERTVARVINVVETNTTAMSMLAEGQREAAKTASGLEIRLIEAVRAIRELADKVVALTSRQGLLTDRQDALNEREDAREAQAVAKIE